MAAKSSVTGAGEFLKSLPYHINIPRDVSILLPRAGSSDVSLHKLTATPDNAWAQIQVEKNQKVETMTPQDPSSPPLPGHTRFVCISDTHSRTDSLNVPAGDVLLHAGDFSNIGQEEDVFKFNAFLGSLPHRYKVVIAGNHDISFDTEEYAKTLWKNFSHKKKLNSNKLKSLISNALYLEDFGCELLGFRIFGSPWQPEFFNWGFNLKRGQLLLDKWNKIPDSTDILMTHGPPIGHGDMCIHGGRAGCVELLATIQKRVKPKVHVFGHIHEGYGQTTDGNTVYINASTCTLKYLPIQPPIVFDLPTPEAVHSK